QHLRRADRAGRLCNAADRGHRDVDVVDYRGCQCTAPEPSGAGGEEASGSRDTRFPVGGSAARMNILIYFIPIALFLGGLGLLAFLWTLKDGQYEDLDGAAWRAIEDDEDRPAV